MVMCYNFFVGMCSRCSELVVLLVWKNNNHQTSNVIRAPGSRF